MSDDAKPRGHNLVRGMEHRGDPKAVIDPRLYKVNLLVNIGPKVVASTHKVHTLGPEIDVVVFDLRRELVPQGVFDARANEPTGSRVSLSGSVKRRIRL
jgi:hypothetical protein